MKYSIQVVDKRRCSSCFAQFSVVLLRLVATYCFCVCVCDSWKSFGEGEGGMSVAEDGAALSLHCKHTLKLVCSTVF